MPKVYSCPDECPAPVLDYSNYDCALWAAQERQHQADLKAWLIKKGYTGKHTGKIYSVGVADGSADYMIADGSKFFLIHLPYGDAYQCRDVEFVPKKEIIRRCHAREELNALLSNALFANKS